MKALPLILLLTAFLPGCQTTVYRDGKPILRTQANAKRVEFHQDAKGATSLVIDGLNHSVPTRAGGSVAGTVGTSIVSGISAAAGF